MDISEKYEIIIEGLKKFFEGSNGKAVIGLSGGIDSAVVAVLVSDAIGAENLICVNMPTKYNSDELIFASQELANNLNAEFTIHSIQKLLEAFEFEFPTADELTHQNIQSRIRGLMLMTYGNKEYRRVIDCTNKTELFVGYITMYGDTVGGISPMGDLLKKEVYELAEFLNKKHGDVIPKTIIDRAPSAELSLDQKDEDDLPKYSTIDSFIEAFENGKSIEKLMELFGEKITKELLDKNNKGEWKRLQFPPIIKINQGVQS